MAHDNYLLSTIRPVLPTALPEGLAEDEAIEEVKEQCAQHYLEGFPEQRLRGISVQVALCLFLALFHKQVSCRIFWRRDYVVHIRELDLPTFQPRRDDMLNSDKPLFRELGALCIQDSEGPCPENAQQWSITQRVVQCSSGNAVFGHTVQYAQEWLQFPKAPLPLPEDHLVGLRSHGRYHNFCKYPIIL